MTPLDSDRHSDFWQRVEPLLNGSGAYARSVLGRRADAEDAVQEALLRAWRRFDSYDRSRPFKGWWYSVVRNCCVDALRARRVQAGEAGTDADELPSPAAAPQDVVHEHELIQWALGRLPDAERGVIDLRYFANCSYTEIAAALRTPVGTVKSRLHSARRLLADLYAETDDGTHRV